MTAARRSPRRNQGAPRAWQRMLSGRRLDLLDPSPLDVEIEDIAHGLARVARWNGQTNGDHAFSVAQHCVLVERMAGELKPRLAREGAAGGAAARRAGICGRRPHQPVQGGGRHRLQGFRAKAARGDPYPLRPAAQTVRDLAAAHQEGRQHRRLSTRPPSWPALAARRPGDYFGRPPAALRPPRLVPLRAARGPGAISGAVPAANAHSCVVDLSIRHRRLRSLG